MNDSSMTRRRFVPVVAGLPLLGHAPQAVLVGTDDLLTGEPTFESASEERHGRIGLDVAEPREMAARG